MVQSAVSQTVECEGIKRKQRLCVAYFLHFAVQEYTALLYGFSKTELCIW